MAGVQHVCHNRRATCDFFLYTKLDMNAAEFRVLKVEAGQINDPLVCSLDVVSFTTSQLPAYETVSYHWGGSVSNTQHIEFHGGELPKGPHATINNELFILPLRAEQAIRRLRLQSRDRTLWIDSICINQDDKEERQHQIALMGEIFRHGIRNLVHLGIDEAGEAMAAIDDLRTATKRLMNGLKELTEDAQRLWHEYRIMPRGWGKLEQPPVLLDDPKPLQAIFRCAWFTRLWIIQETCLAAENICYWGNKEFDLLDLLDVIHVSRELDSLVERDDAKELTPSYFNVQQLRYSIQRSHQFNSANFDHVQEAMMDLIHTACSSGVTVERDRVYGLVGLLRAFHGSPQANKLLRADYDKPLGEVSRDATRAILMLSQTDELLADIRHRNPSDLHDQTKPSWSYYFDRPTDMSLDPGRITYYTTFHAGIPPKNSRLESPFAIAGAEDNPDILCIRGLLIGGVKYLTQPVPYGSLVNDAQAMTKLIDDISMRARAQHDKNGSLRSPYGRSNLREVSITTDPKSRALCIREREKANEIIRRRINRRLGNAEIAAFENRDKPQKITEDTNKPKESQYQPDILEHNIDMTTIEVLTNSWWSVQYENDENVAVQAFRDLREHMRRHGELPQILSEAFNMSVVIACCSNLRRFFATDAGDLGCGRNIMETGDQIAVFIGAKYPYILRPSKNGTYRLVGMAIIPAMMHGEAFEMGLQEQEFRIC